jgi:hypothetical protein
MPSQSSSSPLQVSNQGEHWQTLLARPVSGSQVQPATQSVTAVQDFEQTPDVASNIRQIPLAQSPSAVHGCPVSSAGTASQNPATQANPVEQLIPQQGWLAPPQATQVPVEQANPRPVQGAPLVQHS